MPDGVLRASAIVPVLDEAANVDGLLEALLAQRAHGLQLEVIVVDGGSRDGTRERVRRFEAIAPVRLVEQRSRGLAQAVLEGARAAANDVVVVMDADGSHPPEKLAALVSEVTAGRADVALGSRYVRGARIVGWPWQRRLASRVASLLAVPFCDARDPLSGYFALRRATLLEHGERADGYKIALEVLARGDGALRVTEVPIVFRDRCAGKSKLGARTLGSFARQLVALASGRNAPSGALAGVALALGLVDAVATLGVQSGVLAALLPALGALAVYAVACRASTSRALDATRLAGVAVVATALRLALSGAAQASPTLALTVAAGVAGIQLGAWHAVALSRAPARTRWRLLALGTFGCALALRALYAGRIELLPQEAYYWNYAQHLAFGYLDHPPLVAWLIALGTAAFGDSELGVRAGALACGIVASGFGCALAARLFGRSAALVSLAFLGALPFFFASGTFMTPDAPLVAAWAGALYFLERAFLGERRSAWWGVGACIGLGLLAKYTITLLGLAAVAFAITDPPARRWLRRPEPWLAVALALLLFSPVIVWNAQHDWASFAFQTTRRLRQSDFALPELVGALLVLVTPAVALSGARALLRVSDHGGSADVATLRRHRFALLHAAVPLAVFTWFSLEHPIKLNWTGPLWLVLVPVLAAALLRGQTFARWAGASAGASLALTALVLAYLSAGAPFQPASAGGMPALPAGWRELAAHIDEIERDVETTTGEDALVVGLDRYMISSALAFYGGGDGAGRSLVGSRSSLMYDYWFPAADQRGRPVVLVSFSRRRMTRDYSSYFERVGDVQEGVLSPGSPRARRYYWRVGEGYRPAPRVRAELERDENGS